LKDLIKTHRGERKEFFSTEDEQIRQKKKQKWKLKICSQTPMKKGKVVASNSIISKR
jgi:hypothetical protein